MAAAAELLGGMGDWPHNQTTAGLDIVAFQRLILLQISSPDQFQFDRKKRFLANWIFFLNVTTQKEETCARPFSLPFRAACVSAGQWGVIGEGAAYLTRGKSDSAQTQGLFNCLQAFGHHSLHLASGTEYNMRAR